MKRGIILLLALTQFTIAQKTYTFGIKGIDDSVSPPVPIKGAVRLDYNTPSFQFECRCEYVNVDLTMNNGKKYSIKKMRIGGQNCCDLGPHQWGGNWKVRDSTKLKNLFFSFFSNTGSSDKELGSVSSMFKFKDNIYRWGGENNNTLVKNYGISLPGIFYGTGKNVKKDPLNPFGYTLTWIVTVPLALALFFLDFVFGSMAGCMNRKELSPYFSILNSASLNVVFILLGATYTSGNSMWMFVALLIPTIFLVVIFLTAKSGARGRNSGSFIIVEAVYFSLMVFVTIASPFFCSYIAPISAALTGYECMKYSENKNKAQLIGIYNFIKAFFIWLYLSTPITPADITVNGALGFIPLTILIMSLLALFTFLGKSKGTLDSVIVVQNQYVPQVEKDFNSFDRSGDAENGGYAKAG